MEARRKMLSLFQPITPGSKLLPGSGIIAGFFYRDLDGDGDLSIGETLPATLVGTPTLADKNAGVNCYFNCYWIDPLEAGTTCIIIFTAEGVAPFSQLVKVETGINLVHIPIVLEKPLIYIVPHSHFDTEWVYSYEECLTRVEFPNIRRRLDLLQEEPAHCFTNDEECVTLPFVERSEPVYTNLLHQGIIDGTIEPKGIVTQQELTMPYGESLIRNICMGELILSSLLGETIRPEIYWSIDQYGVGYQLPQILAKAGRKYLLSGEYSSDRVPLSDSGTREHLEFWLESPDGSKVLTHRGPYFIDGPEPPWIEPPQSHKSGLNLQGVDNGPPNEELISIIKRLNSENGKYNYIAASSSAFFRAIERDPIIPTFSAESFITRWAGVYESRIQSKMLSRQLENHILAAETLATCAGLEGMRYPEILNEAWILLLLNQHHDPLMSPMATPGLFQNAIPARYESARAQVSAALTTTLSWLSTDMATDEREGQPVIVFNPYVGKRSAVVEAAVMDLKDEVRVVDCTNRAVPVQVIRKQGRQSIVAFNAQEMPSLGWKTFYISQAKNGGPIFTGTEASENHLENDHIRIELEDGMVRRITEKDTDSVVLEAAQAAGVNEIIIWKDPGCISIVHPLNSSETVDILNNPDVEIVARSSLAFNRKVTVEEKGPARGVIRVAFELDCGNFVQEISLDAGSRVVNFTTHVDWAPGEKVTAGEGRRIRAAFRTNYHDAKVNCDIPFGVIQWKQSEQIRPVNSWLGMDGDDTGIAMCHFGQHSIQAVDDIAYMTLFRSVKEPSLAAEDPMKCNWDNPLDEALEDGLHTFHYSLFIHPGDWKKSNVPAVSEMLNKPLIVKETNRHSGKNGALFEGVKSYIDSNPEDIVVTAVKPAEYQKRGVIVRVFNPKDVEINGTISINFPHSSVASVNFREEICQEISGDAPYGIHMAPHEIKTLWID